MLRVATRRRVIARLPAVSGGRLQNRQAPALRRPPPSAEAGRAGPGASSSLAIAARRSATAGSRLYQIHVPRRSPCTRPASRSTRRWCDTVGWDRPSQAEKSQAQTAPSDASWRTMARRAGSASAARRRMSGSADFGMAASLSTSFYIDNPQYIA